MALLIVPNCIAAVRTLQNHVIAITWALNNRITKLQDRIATGEQKIAHLEERVANLESELAKYRETQSIQSKTIDSLIQTQSFNGKTLDSLTTSVDSIGDAVFYIKMLAIITVPPVLAVLAKLAVKEFSQAEN